MVVHQVRRGHPDGRAFLELKAEVDGVLGPKDVARVREKLGLSQRKAGEPLGGGPRAFYKYERGEQAVSLPMSHLLRLLENDPGRIAELKRGARGRVRAGGKPSPALLAANRAGADVGLAASVSQPKAR
jgi:DNA-binding transcriptional regulator YiaG